MKLEINNRRKTGKVTSIQKLNNTILNNQIVKDELKREIKKYLETNKNGNTKYQSLWDTAKAVVRGKLTVINEHIKKISGFPGGVVVENLPANAGDTGSSPGLGRSHMPWSNQAHEPQLLSLRIWSLCSTTREAAIVRGPCTAMKSGPLLPQLEKALAQKRRPNTAINK